VPIDDELGARLAAYLDGEADDADRRAIEEAVERDPAARQALDEMRAARDLLCEYDTHTDVSTARASEPPDLVGTPVDHFLIECPLGCGGMGQVYRALDTSLNRPVAVKVISPRLTGDAKVVDRFVREARLQSQIDHPHVAHVYFVGQHEGHRYFAMEYLPGGSLEDRLRRDGSLEPDEAIGVVLEVADILRSVRRSGVVHRDLKPSNIMFTADGSIKLTDFGIARPDDDEGT